MVEKDGEEGRVRNIQVTDDTGKTRITLWDDDVEAAGQLSPGENAKVVSGYSEYSDYFGGPEIHLGDEAELVKVDTEENLLLKPQ